MPRIIVRRKNTFLAFAVSFKVVVDGYECGILKNGQEVQIQVPLGWHGVMVKTFEDSKVQNVCLTPEKDTVVLYVEPSIGVLVAHAQITHIEYLNTMY